MSVRNEIKAQIVRAGFTMQEVVDLLHDEYDWSDSVSNLSAKLQRESIRYKEVVELADVLGYDLVWQKRRANLMSKPQFAILRFAKYKGPEVSKIEAHNERTKEKYASNPDVDTSRSHLNFHLVTPQRKYRAEAEKQIAEAGCRTRSDSVRLVEALMTATPDFFKGKKKAEIKAYFQEALDFIKQNRNPETIISAVVHMDEKTPHMHLSFVPLTEDGRLSAKGKAAEIGAFLDKYIPAVEQMHTTLKKYNTAFTVTTAENKKLKKKTEQLEQSLDKATQGSTLKKLADAKLHRDYEDAVAVLDRIPKEVLAAYTHGTEKGRETAYGR